MKTRKSKKEFENKYPAADALKKGSMLTRLSVLVFGTGCLAGGADYKGSDLSCGGGCYYLLYDSDWPSQLGYVGHAGRAGAAEGLE